jgi:hypothetical protein
LPGSDRPSTLLIMTTEESISEATSRLLPTQAEESTVEPALASLAAARKATAAGSGSLRDLVDDVRTR